MEVPFFSSSRQHQAISDQLKIAFDRQLQDGAFILGERVQEFEKAFAAFHQMPHCTSVANGMDAIFIALKSLQIGLGDEVLVPSHTCFATWLAVSRTGATPVPVEVNPVNFTIDTNLLEAAATARTKAILPVHLYGHPCEMPAIMAIANKRNWSVVEDNAQSHGAICHQKPTGSWGDLSATSFYPTKNLGALGDGGAILSKSATNYEFHQAFRNYGSVQKDVHQMQGVNSRLDELQAAFLLVKLPYLAQWNAQRMAHTKMYHQQLSGVGDLKLPSMGDENHRPVFHLYVIQTAYRDRLKNYLADQGIGTAIHYPTPIHLQDTYRDLGYKEGSLPIAERLSKTVLSLPVWPELQPSEIERVTQAIRAFFERYL
ncbi:MAG: DegT/DnrJ/EryC1/StrS family aminotransferase [Cyclobacteriaceae bacterium]|nr:DegT/DnrJ/EryC1/StrS family aminotransferase [Cyclobacteriaceae bacterium]